MVLLVAIGLASYSSVNHGITGGLLRLGAANPLAHSMAQGGQVADVALGRDGVVLKPAAIPTAVPVRHDPISYPRPISVYGHARPPFWRKPA